MNIITYALCLPVQALEFMSLHREQVKTLIIQDHLTQFKAEKEEKIAKMEKELENLQAQIEKEKQLLA